MRCVTLRCITECWKTCIMRDDRSESNGIRRDQFDANYQSERSRRALVRSLYLVDS